MAHASNSSDINSLMSSDAKTLDMDSSKLHMYSCLNQISPSVLRSSSRKLAGILGTSSAVTRKRRHSSSECHASDHQPRLPHGVESATSLPPDVANMGLTL